MKMKTKSIMYAILSALSAIFLILLGMYLRTLINGEGNNIWRDINGNIHTTGYNGDSIYLCWWAILIITIALIVFMHKLFVSVLEYKPLSK